MLRRSIQQCHVLTTTRGLWPPPNFCRSHDLRNRLGQVKAMWSHCRPVVLVVCDASPFCLCCVCMRGVVCMCACNGGLGRAQVDTALSACVRAALSACVHGLVCLCVRAMVAWPHGAGGVDAASLCACVASSGCVGWRASDGRG